MTIRDHVWHEVLRTLIKQGKFKISDLPFNSDKRHTARRVLKEMEELGWVTRTNNRAATWRLGDVGASHLNVHSDIIEDAQR